MEVLVPPKFVAEGLGENRVPRLGDIKGGAEPQGSGLLAVSFSMSSDSLELLAAHAHVGSVNEKPACPPIG